MYVLATYLALAILATPLHATIPIFLLYAGLAMAVIVTLGTKPPEISAKISNAYILIIPAVFFALMRAIPFMGWGSSALGADMGAYYKNFNACFASLAACLKEPVALLGYPPYAMGIGTQVILIAIHFIAGVALFAGVYRLAKKEWGVEAALWSASIYALSVPQFLFYWSFFLKMEIAAALSLFALHAHAENRWRAALYATLAGSIHPLPFMPLAAALLITGMLGKEKIYSLATVAISTTIVCAVKWSELAGYYGYIASYAHGTHTSGTESLLAGHFVGFSFYHDALMLFYIPFALITLAWGIAARKVPAIGWYALVNLGLISINAAFHNRFIILFDISCAVLAGYALSHFAKRYETSLGRIALSAAVALIAINALARSARMEPLVNKEEFKELLALDSKYSGLPIFINNATYRQFVTGYTAHPVIHAPFNDEPWKALGAPSLIYNARRSTPINPRGNPHFISISERVLKYSP